LLLRDERTHLRVGVCPRTDLDPFGDLGQPPLYLVEDLILHQDPGSGHTVLSGRAVREPREYGEGSVQVGVLKDYARRFPAKLQHDLLYVLGRGVQNLLAGLDAAGEADHRHVRVRDQTLADVGAGAHDTVDRPRGQIRILHRQTQDAHQR
jgi:hypothetical protein